MSTDPAETLRRFVYVVSHDLQGPLRRIASFSDLLVEELGDDLSDDATMFLTFIKDNAALAQQRVEGLRLVSRAMRAEPQLRDDVDVDALFREAADQGGVPADAVTVQGGARLRTDPELLVRILVEGMKNAREWGAGDGLTVRCACERSSDGWRLTVSDAGPGIDESRRELVFEPFHQLRPDGAEGVGVGLSVARALTERLGGALTLVAPVDGPGVGFALSLPPHPSGPVA